MVKKFDISSFQFAIKKFDISSFQFAITGFFLIIVCAIKNF